MPTVNEVLERSVLPLVLSRISIHFSEEMFCCQGKTTKMVLCTSFFLFLFKGSLKTAIWPSEVEIYKMSSATSCHHYYQFIRCLLRFLAITIKYQIVLLVYKMYFLF